MDHGRDDVTESNEQQSKKDSGGGGGNGDRPEHRRSKSGSLLSGFSFLRSAKESVPKQPADDDGPPENAEGAKRGPSVVTALRQIQGRQRKGSLRKAAMAKMRERSSSIRKERTPGKPPTIITTMSTTSFDDETTPRRFNYEHASFNSSSDSGWHPENNLFLSTSPTGTSLQAPPSILSPNGPYASTTTDDDDTLSFFRPSSSSNGNAFNIVAQGPAISLSRRRSNRSERRLSLAEVQPPSDLDLDDDWDYSETEWWGWVVLIVTWIVFVVGMGSCLGVWSWAWDVGETPYAPPELEDDESLPITGYYPALMVCTAVMSWVWVVVAWVGMKYFRHAKVVGEEG
ncbi:hypothetical protein P153DRAFT_381923 [Dothidotthia symphoricarpi CBS 119687]|uniref:Uncharacterized protein n=1 Tax=Dothidotthia symphoricarpi CBS 119687 TaxID=1392245 RepID=A0A6A6ASI3_9PLEO|nr:uncharacterized protein P153DRAFT_381923 [Dothidotthia symphoricarpi CBS 119687]KAF2133491.1 hypothetical protein P153DRAFT_381923 [Dothidotthia symphoricarpi CBS 119687]